MTVNYNLLISDSTPLNRIKLLFRWRGSIWKALLSELTLWVICFTGVACIYNIFLSEDQQRSLVRLTKHLNDKMDYIPLNFILSFFVTAVVTRWTYIYHNIGLIENLALSVAFHIPGTSDRVRMLRRNIIRYAVQAQLLVFRDVSTQVRKRFPNLETTVTANFFSENEMTTLLSFDSSHTFTNYWMPIVWAQNAVHLAKEEGFIKSDIQYKTLSDNLIEWRNQLAQVVNYDWVPLPLMYPQLVILAVHSYFYICLISRQITFLDYQQRDLGVIEENISKCVFSVLQFIFYVGWLRVAEALLNPMGEDDDDFETNYILDRNFKTGLAIVDRGVAHCAALVEDSHWDHDQPLLYTENSRPVHPLYGSAVQMEFSQDDSDSENMIKQPPVKMVPLEGDNDEMLITRKPTRIEMPRLMLDRIRKSHGSLTPKDFRGTPNSNLSPTSSPTFKHVGFTLIDEENKNVGPNSITETLQLPNVENHRRALDDIKEEDVSKNGNDHRNEDL